jgi:hypothetical protein
MHAQDISFGTYTSEFNPGAYFIRKNEMSNHATSCYTVFLESFHSRETSFFLLMAYSNIIQSRRHIFDMTNESMCLTTRCRVPKCDNVIPTARLSLLSLMVPGIQVQGQNDIDSATPAGGKNYCGQSYRYLVDPIFL